MTFQELQPKVTAITVNTIFSEMKTLAVCQLFTRQYRLLQLGWVLFANQETKTLHLGPYVGAETDHTVIPLGKAYVGQVSNNNFVVLMLQHKTIT
jgi:GAF domain-containing protein